MNIKYSKAAAGTFALNKGEPIHRWYSYLEGYSSRLIDDLIKEIGAANISAIYDPFCGTGTTVLVASQKGINSYYSETNPFMRTVIEAKVNRVKRLRDSSVGSKYLRIFLQDLKQFDIKEPESRVTWDGFEKYFDNKVLFIIQKLLEMIKKIMDQDSQEIMRIILSSVIVRSSRMVRQGDLRYAKAKEKDEADWDILANFSKKIEDAIVDIESVSCPTLAETTCLSNDSRDINNKDLVDCIITSPPYLNGTNYVRNTKLELKLSGFICSESDLPALHSKGIIAGINNVSKRNSVDKTNHYVGKYLEQLEPVAYDKRIPLMVAGYFNDMEQVIDKLSQVLKDRGFFIMDIGDSQFAGVYIPTHEILAAICKDYGFELYAEEILRKRRSKNGMVLSQRLMKFRLDKQKNKKETFHKEAKDFMNNMPYREIPYSSRNWGHPWHSLCSYHGKLKPAIAHFLIKQFTSPGEIILDPLCGVGTIPLEACLQGRIGIGNDLSELAYIVTKAKLERSSHADCIEVVKKMRSYIKANVNSKEIDKLVEKYKEFGFNGKLETYFHPQTYRELLCARCFFLEKAEKITTAEAMVFSCLLHVIHGNRPYALSRNSHPLTPYAPKGEFVYKNVAAHIEEKLALSYTRGTFETYVKGKAIHGDYNLLTSTSVKADAIICSPPFVDSLRFYMQNWMRLWLCGWEAEDYKLAEYRFLDQKQKKNLDLYYSFFEKCASVLKPQGRVILHLGKTDTVDMAQELSIRASIWFEEIYRCDEKVNHIEKHGIKDKGGTISHQYLFLQKRNSVKEPDSYLKQHNLL